MAKDISRDVLDLADGLHSAAIHLLRQVRVEDRASGIGPAQLSALSVLVFGGSMSLKRLAEIEQVKPPTMVRIVRGLGEQRLVRTRADKHDRRKIAIAATAKSIDEAGAGTARGSIGPRGRGDGARRTTCAASGGGGAEESAGAAACFLSRDQKAAAPASATAWSWSPEPPLTPMAPTTLPSRFRGIPPAKIMILPLLDA